MSLRSRTPISNIFLNVPLLI